MPNPYPEGFRRDVVAVARKHEAPLSQIARDFGTSVVHPREVGDLVTDRPPLRKPLPSGIESSDRPVTRQSKV